MAPLVIDLSKAEDQRDVVHRTVQALAENQLVVFPTETVYGIAASALSEEAVGRLIEIKGRKAGHPLTLAIKSVDEALDYVPEISPVGLRLARRCWPGPVTLVLDDEHPDSVKNQLPDLVRQAIAPNGTIGLRVPAHPLVLSILRLTSGPLALTSANRSGEPDAVTAGEVLHSLGNDVALVLDDGRSKFGQPSSVVRVVGNRVQLLRRGVIAGNTLKRLSSWMILLVCTGNTCRSPMAEAMMRAQLAASAGCEPAALDEHGAMVMSAGIAAMSGGHATPEAVQVMAERGLDLSRHESQPLSERLVRFADLILTMTRGHRDAIVAHWPEASDRVQLLCRSGEIADPIGGAIDLYRQCAGQIEQEVSRWLEELALNGSWRERVPALLPIVEDEKEKDRSSSGNES